MRRQCCWTTDLPSNKNAYWLIFKSNMSRTVQQICWTTETVVQQSDARICCTTKIPLYNKTVQQKLSNKNTTKSVVQQQKLSNKYETVQQIGNCTTNTVQQIWNCPTKRLTKTVQQIQNLSNKSKICPTNIKLSNKQQNGNCCTTIVYQNCPTN